MSVAAANEWYHAERRVMSKRQWQSGRVQRRRPQCSRFESFDQNFLLLLLYFFALCIMRKIICNRKHFLRFFKNRNRLKMIVLLEKHN